MVFLSRWEFNGIEYTVNYDKWYEMMDTIYNSTGLLTETDVVVLDMNSTSVEDYARIQGVTKKSTLKLQRHVLDFILYLNEK